MQTGNPPKGYIPIDIPTKKYIAAYVRAQLGSYPVMSSDNHIGNKMQALLNRKKLTNEERNRFANSRYNTTMRVYISRRTMLRKGKYLNETNIKELNSYIEGLVKDKFYFIMDFYIDLLPSFYSNLPEARRQLKIDDDEWDDESMRMDYYRHRVRTGKKKFYKNSAATVTPGNFSNCAFF